MHRKQNVDHLFLLKYVNKTTAQFRHCPDRITVDMDCWLWLGKQTIYSTNGWLITYVSNYGIQIYFQTLLSIHHNWNAPISQLMHTIEPQSLTI